MEEIVNKVAQSGLITIDLEALYPKGKRSEIDIAAQLWQGLALREKDFREWIKTNDWQQFQNNYVAVYCSVDAIVPHWAYMLVASALQGIAARVVLGDPGKLEEVLFLELIQQLDPKDYVDGRIVVKGCGDLPVPVSAYVEIVNRLQPVAKSIMFGEPCSTVPVYKKIKS